MDNIEKQNTEMEKPVQVEKESTAEAGGDGNKKKGGDTSSSRWGQEGLSAKDWGQRPKTLRSPSERELSEYEDNTTTVGQPGDRSNLGGSNRWDSTVTSGGRDDEGKKG